MKQLYLIRDKHLYRTKVSKNNPEPLKKQIALDPPVSHNAFEDNELMHWKTLLEQHFDQYEYSKGEIKVRSLQPEYDLERLNLFFPWLRRFHDEWDTGLAIRTIGLRAELREA